MRGLTAGHGLPPTCIALCSACPLDNVRTGPVPAQPDAPIVMQRTATSLTLHWEAPPSYSGVEALTYKVTPRKRKFTHKACLTRGTHARENVVECTAFRFIVVESLGLAISHRGVCSRATFIPNLRWVRTQIIEARLHLGTFAAPTWMQRWVR